MRNRHWQVRLVKDPEPILNPGTKSTIDAEELSKTLIQETTKSLVILMGAWRGMSLACRLTEHIVVTKIK